MPRVSSGIAPGSRIHRIRTILTSRGCFDIASVTDTGQSLKWRRCASRSRPRGPSPRSCSDIEASVSRSSRNDTPPWSRTSRSQRCASLALTIANQASHYLRLRNSPKSSRMPCIWSVHQSSLRPTSIAISSHMACLRRLLAWSCRCAHRPLCT